MECLLNKRNLTNSKLISLRKFQENKHISKRTNRIHSRPNQ